VTLQDPTPQSRPWTDSTVMENAEEHSKPRLDSPTRVRGVERGTLAATSSALQQAGGPLGCAGRSPLLHSTRDRSIRD
jgi:hypothetical protein